MKQLKVSHDATQYRHIKAHSKLMQVNIIQREEFKNENSLTQIRTIQVFKFAPLTHVPFGTPETQAITPQLNYKNTFFSLYYE